MLNLFQLLSSAMHKVLVVSWLHPMSWYYQSFWFLVILLGRKWYLTEILIYISLRTNMLITFSCAYFGKGNGNPLQYSCLENPVDRGAWWAAVHRVTQSWTRQKQLSMHPCIGEGHGNPFQCSCLENPRDGGAWWAAVYGVAQSQTRLKRLSSSSSPFPC